MATPVVYVLIINWNGLEHLQACFDSLLASTYAPCKFCLVDNASTDGSVSFVRDHYGADPRVEIFECPENLGWSGGNNAAIRHALREDPAYIFLLNNDTAIDARAIELLVDAAESHSRVGALAPKMLLFQHPDILNSVGLTCSIIGGCWDRGIGRLDGPQWNESRDIIGVCGGAMFIRASLLSQTGLLPEEFEIYMDDLDLCLRIWDAGYTIQTCPGAVVRHKFSATYGTGDRARYKYFLNTRNRFWLLLRNFPASALVRALPWLLLGEGRAIGRAALEGSYWRIGAHVKAWRATLLQVPTLLTARRRRKESLPHFGAFFPLIHKHPLFCPAIQLPDGQGWYDPIDLHGQRLKPMGRRALYHPAAGSLVLRHANLHPHLGKTRIRVIQDGRVLAILEDGTPSEVQLSVADAPLHFEADSIFSAGDTGEPMDCGGWIALHSDS